MTAAVTLWIHALAALAFAAAALAAWRRPEGPTRGVFAAALLLSGLWALAVAGIDARDLSTRLVEAARNLAWLAFMLLLVRRARTGGWALAAVYAVVAIVIVLGAALALGESIARGPRVEQQLAVGRLLFGMMGTAGALVLVQQLYRAAHGEGPDGGSRGVGLIAIALGLMWGADLTVSAAAYLAGTVPVALLGLRGLTDTGVAILLATAAQRRDSWTLALSRPTAIRALALVALVLYLGVAAGLTGLASYWGGEQARPLQAGIVIGAAAALLTLLSTSWFGPWAKVKLAKHLFRHRYDYRTEWQRFTDRLGEGGVALEQRAAQAVAELLDAPASLLLTPDGTQAAWRWDAAGAPLDTTLIDHLTRSRRIVELDAVRKGDAPETAVVPAWMTARADAWALVPLLHGAALAGVVLLARPPVPRPLDWEDFDLLRVAGRQAASYLAEDRAGRALAEAQRFDEFHRRFAFILHDIKNLVSQQQLVARNAERHAHNPAFRADMIATLKDSADRMTSLIARLSQAEPAAGEPLRPVDCALVLQRLAAAKNGERTIEVNADTQCWAIGHAQRLEQVVGHLLQNALEASATGTPVTLSAARVDGRVAIDVIDRGAGMTAAFVRDQLFRPFVSTKLGGFGIGAFEARQLVAAMGGEIHVDSREGEGTRFRILLAAAPALEAAA